MYTFKDLEKYLDSILVREKIPGFDCKIYHKGKEVFRYFNGYSDRENQIKMNGEEYYYIYSASKPITCAVALHAFEEGAFLLHEPLWWYLPEFRNCMVKEKQPDGTEKLVPLDREIRIQDLFSMSAGLNYNCESEQIKEVIAKTNGRAPTREVIKGIAKMPLEFQPREDFCYSLCHDVLACLVEVATKTRFQDYVKKVIFDPLGMDKTTYRINDEILSKMMQQYRYNFEMGKVDLVGKKNDYIFGTEYDSGGAGVITTMDDYSKFAYAMAHGGVGMNGSRILSKSTIDLMRTNVLDGKRLETFRSWNSNVGYGYGFGVRTKIDQGLGGSLTSIGEFGWDGAAGTLISIDPDRELAIVYMQQMLNPLHEVTHPRIKNLTVLALGY